MQSYPSSSTFACRICKCTELVEVVNLGTQVNTAKFPKYGEYLTERTPVCLYMCTQCNLVQLKDTLLQSEMYEGEYGYRSGISNTMRDHLKSLCDEVILIASLSAGDAVLDIGCNDGTFLRYYSSDIVKVGIDPTAKQFAEYYVQSPEIQLHATYFTCDLSHTHKYKIVTSISMFYDLPDPVQFAKDVRAVLADDGIWCLEQSYLMTMLKRNSIDTICHEHIEYYAVKQIKHIMELAGLKIISITENDCNGGSFRIIVCKRECDVYNECTDLIEQYLRKETEYGLNRVEVYRAFVSGFDTEIRKLVSFIKGVRECGKRVYIYGASTKGNCILQYAGIDESLVQYAVERNLNKVGKMTSTGIPIISEETMRADPPNYLLVLPWHFKNEIIAREDTYLADGGQLIFPLPHFQLHSSKPRVLITGIHGQIGSYLAELYMSSHIVYGVSTHAQKGQEYVSFTADVSNYEAMETIITSVNPYAIAHLASKSEAKYSVEHSLDAININGMSTINICDILIKTGMTNVKLFNASSSEIYKGHGMYIAKEDDVHFKPTHPYAIAKQLGHTYVNYIRKKYEVPFSNGVIFTNESSRRKSSFLFKKIALHAKQWLIDKVPLNIGSLDAYRSILHASDVASAIKIILEQETGDNYNICSNNAYKLYDIMHFVYEYAGIQITKNDNIWIETSTGITVLIIGAAYHDDNNTNIQGVCKKLYSLHWHPQYGIKDICKEVLCADPRRGLAVEADHA